MRDIWTKAERLYQLYVGEDAKLVFSASSRDYGYHSKFRILFWHYLILEADKIRGSDSCDYPEDIRHIESNLLRAVGLDTVVRRAGNCLQEAPQSSLH